MAIPLSMPNSDEIDDGHRLDLLLEQLLITLRQVLIHRRRMAAAAAAAAAAVSRTNPHHRCRHEEVDRTRTEENEESRRESEMEETRVTEEETTPTTTTTSSSVQCPLPDLVLDSPSVKESQRPGRMCHCEHGDHFHQRLHGGRGDATSWVEDDGELIRLAGQLLDQEEMDGKRRNKMKKKEDEEEKMNVLSLMCPLLGNSVWTTVALLVVWGLLSRAR